MKGWTKDGTEVDLTPQQVILVRMLLSRHLMVLPPRGLGIGWSTVLATAARMDAEGYDPGPPDPQEGSRLAEQWVREEMARRAPVLRLPRR